MHLKHLITSQPQSVTHPHTTVYNCPTKAKKKSNRQPGHRGKYSNKTKWRKKMCNNCTFYLSAYPMTITSDWAHPFLFITICTCSCRRHAQLQVIFIVCILCMCVCMALWVQGPAELEIVARGYKIIIKAENYKIMLVFFFSFLSLCMWFSCSAIRFLSCIYLYLTKLQRTSAVLIAETINARSHKNLSVRYLLHAACSIHKSLVCWNIVIVVCRATAAVLLNIKIDEVANLARILRIYCCCDTKYQRLHKL